MRIAFFVNDLEKEVAGYTTTALAFEALKAGHEIWYITPGDFAFDQDDRLSAHATTAPRRKYDSTDALLEAVQGEKARIERISVDDLDVLMLRNDPSQDFVERPWATNAGIIFGQVAAAHGVIVLNDPFGLAKAMNKLYFQQFPAEIRPATIITRDRGDIKQFVKEQGGTAVVKPLQGSGGQNVFLVSKENAANLNQMIDAVTRDGYCIVQEYLPEAKKGDVRFFLINGAPFEHEGKYAAFARTRAGDDMRSNMHVGGKAEKAKITDTALRIAEMVRPKLIRDGMFLVGLDLVGDKLMEINVFSPGGLHSVSKLTKVNFPRKVIEAIERKVAYERLDEQIENAELAVL